MKERHLTPDDEQRIDEIHRQIQEMQAKINALPPGEKHHVSHFAKQLHDLLRDLENEEMAAGSFDFLDVELLVKGVQRELAGILRRVERETQSKKQ